MKLSEAIKIIEDFKVKGYRIRFAKKEYDQRDGEYLSWDSIPEKDAILFSTVKEASEFAKEFAQATECRFYDITITDSNNKPITSEKVLNKSSQRYLE